MQRSEFSYRFRRNPWPWCIGVLVLILALMWIRQYRMIQEELVTLNIHRPFKERMASSPRNQAKPPLTGIMLLRGPPEFVDPFGNFYYATYRSGKHALPSGPAADFYQVLILTANLDGTNGRNLEFRQGSGFLYQEVAAQTDLILPIIFSALLLTFTVLWFRNARRSHLPEP